MTKYQKFSVRSTASQAQGAPFLTWFHTRYNEGTTVESQNGSTGTKRIDVDFAGTSAGAAIYATDLTTNLALGLPWTGSNVLGLRIDRRGMGSAPNTTTYDWARLTVNDTHPSAVLESITWTGNFSANVDVLVGTSAEYRIASSVTSLTNWNYGILPPGSYTIRVTPTAGGTALSQAFTINAPPMIQVLDPDETGGDDFATAVLNNAWDMETASDVQFTTPVSENLVPESISFSSGQFHATNDATLNGPNFMLLYHTNNTIPINSSRYRYFTVRFQVDGGFDLQRGSVARLLWSSLPFDGTTASTTLSWLVHTGMNSYTFDLSTLTAALDGGIEPLRGLAATWLNGQKTYLNFHPHEFNEFTIQRQFHIDDIKLAAIDTTASGIFTIKWAKIGEYGGDPSVALYYDTDRDPTNGKTLIVLNQAMSNGSTGYSWNALGTGVPTGDYWIYAEATDSSTPAQTWGRYSTGRLRVAQLVTTPSPVMAIETPTNNSSVIQPLVVSGWAIDQGASDDTGVDRVEIYAQPAGGTNTFLGTATIFGSRPDIAAVYGTHFNNAGFTYTIGSTTANRLNPGSYTITVRARSNIGSAAYDVRTVNIVIPASNPLMSVDVPTTEANVGSNFTIAGWAVDRAAPSGVGVDRVAVYAFPISGFNQGVTGGQYFLGYLTVGNARPDIGAGLGSQFTNSGFSGTFNATSLSLPTNAYYRIYIYARSLVASLGDPGGGYNNYSLPIDLFVGTSASDPVMYVDQPQAGTVLSVNQSYTVSGWAFDRGFTGAGVGIFDVHVWAFPVSGPNAFVWSASSAVPPAPTPLGQSRTDIGNAYGSQFTNSGYSFVVPPGRVGPGVYDLYVFTFCDLVGVGLPCQARINRVTFTN